MFGRMPMIQTQYCQYPYNRKERENNVLRVVLNVIILSKPAIESYK